MSTLSHFGGTGRLRQCVLLCYGGNQVDYPILVIDSQF